MQNVDAIYERLKPKFEEVAVSKLHGPMDQSYGQQELMVVAPDGNLVVFSQTISKTS